MLISTHLPPPVMIESTDSLALVTHILCCSCGMYFSAAPSSVNDHGSMNLASKTAPVASTMPSSGGGHPADDRMLHLALDIGEDLAGVAFEPVAVEGLGDDAELDDEVAGEVLGLDLAALLPPEAEQGGLVVAHDDPGV